MDVTPEKVLMWSVLERAILDALGFGVEAQSNRINLRRDARQWIRSRKEASYSFEWICLHLNICPMRVRKFVANNNAQYWISTRGQTVGRYFDDVPDWARTMLRM